MGPIVKEASEKYAGKSIEFVKFDFTTDDTKKAAAARAKELGVDEVYSNNAPKSGFAILYDTTKKAVVTKLTAQQDVAQWSVEIDKAFGT